VREQHRVEREQRESHRRHPRTRLISPQARSALRVGYLLKDRVADADELLDAARRVAGGGSAIDPAVIDEVVRSRATQERLAVLTAREREVLELIAEGKSNRSIGERLAISVKTVEAQVATIFSKLGLEADPDDNRRVLAVLVYLEGRG